MTCFYQYCGMPKTIGCIDGCHLRILAPSVKEKAYVNRKGYHSINCQVVCDSYLRLYDLCPRWPGSSHDAFILRNNDMFTDFPKNNATGWLLGDSAYPILPWIMTPLANPQTRGEKRFNGSLTKGRSCVERCNRLLKARFRCLQQCLMFTPEKCSKIALACDVLHNIAIDRNVALRMPIYIDCCSHVYRL